MFCLKWNKILISLGKQVVAKFRRRDVVLCLQHNISSEPSWRAAVQSMWKVYG